MFFPTILMELLVSYKLERDNMLLSVTNVNLYSVKAAKELHMLYSKMVHVVLHRVAEVRSFMRQTISLHIGRMVSLKLRFDY